MLYALDINDRTIYLHADSFAQAKAICLDAIDVILSGMDDMREMVSVTPDQLPN
jgi:hypothetical protein